MNASTFFAIHERIAGEFMDHHPGMPPDKAWDLTRERAFLVFEDMQAAQADAANDARMGK